MSAVAADIGPMARLRLIQGDENAEREILGLIEQGKSFAQIAKEWGLPKKDFLFWVAANGELTEKCKRLRELAGIDLRMEGLDLVDEATVENAQVKKLQAEYRERLSRDLNKPLFGKVVQHEHSGVMPTLVIEIVSGDEVTGEVIENEVTPLLPETPSKREPLI